MIAHGIDLDFERHPRLLPQVEDPGAERVRLYPS